MSDLFGLMVLSKMHREQLEHAERIRTLENERDAAQAEVARLREALRDIAADCKADYPPSHSAIKYVCHLALKEC